MQGTDVETGGGMTQGSDEPLYILTPSRTALRVLRPMKAGVTVLCQHRSGRSLEFFAQPRDDREFVGFTRSGRETSLMPFGSFWTLVTTSELVRLRLEGKVVAVCDVETGG